MRKGIIIIILLIAAFSERAYSLPLEVALVNRTKGEALADYPFKLKVLKTGPDGGQTLLRTSELKTDSKGLYKGDIDTAGGDMLSAEVNYRGITYSMPTDRIVKGQKDYVINLPVYDITDKADDIKIRQRTMVLSPQDDKTMQVFEILGIDNSGKYTYVGRFNDKLDVHQVLYIPLPRGYRLTHIQGMDSNKVYTYNGGLVTQENIRPGEKELLIGYILRSDTGLFDLTLYGQKDSPVPERFTLLFQEGGGWKVRPSGLTAGGETEFYGKKYKTWNGKIGDLFVLKVYGPAYKGQLGRWVFALVLAMIVCIIILYLGRDRIFRWYLLREQQQLRDTLARFKTEADTEELRDYYRPFENLLEQRIGEISRKELH